MDSLQGSYSAEIIDKTKEFLIQLVCLWSWGLKEACSFHRLFFFCKRSRILLKRTGQCFLLNGCIFLGSVLLVRSVISPVLAWILPIGTQTQNSFLPHCSISETGQTIYALFQAVLTTCFYVLWFYPMYVLSFVISSIWYTEIAQQACSVMKQTESSQKGKKDDKMLNTDWHDKRGDLEEVMFMIGEHIYSVLMLSVFFIEVSAVGFIPYIGKLMNFLLLSWVYAYYCFEYKWNSIGWSLKERIDFFEANWAFFAGFGSPCVLATFFSSALISYGIMAILYPLFVLCATASDSKKVIASYSRKQRHNRLHRIPIFYFANATSLRLLKYFQPLPSTVNG